MNALQLVAPQRLEMGVLPDPPDPGPLEVLVRLRASGVCGSDMHTFSEGGIAGTDAAYPCVLGHEPSGEVAAVGPGVTDLSPGAMVAVEPFIVRAECEFTRTGRQNLALTNEFMGREIPGALREYAVLPRRNLMLMPDGMTFGDAAFVEPLAVLLHSYELAELRMGEAVAVMGAGPIGLIAVALAKVAGASVIVAADRIEHRLQRARKLGADVAVNVDRESPVDAVMDLTGCGAHVVIDAAGKSESINNAIACLRPGGRIVIVGIPSDPAVPLNMWTALDREARIHVQKRSNGNDHDALDLLKRGLVRSEDIISHRFPLEQGQEAFETMADFREGVIKPLIEW
jgi:L-iditol 2-dehydrogenase